MMDFDELFENNGKHRKNGHHENVNHEKEYNNEYGHSDNERYGNKGYSSYPINDQSFYLKSLIDKILINKKLKILIGITAGIILLIIIVLFIIFLPLIGKLVDFINENGIQGVVDSAGGILDKLWSGTGAK